MQQISFIESAASSVPPPKNSVCEPEKERILDEFAFLYTCGESGRSSVPRFLMTMEDAQKWCSSDKSKGIIHGNCWMYMFTSIRNFMSCHWSPTDGITIDFRKLEDNGSFDKKLEECGCRKLTKDEAKKLLKTAGFKILD